MRPSGARTIGVSGAGRGTGVGLAVRVGVARLGSLEAVVLGELAYHRWEHEGCIRDRSSGRNERTEREDISSITML